MTNLQNHKTRFILNNTAITSPPHLPEIRLYLADEAHELWSKTEEELEAIGLPPPFWAFAWAGGQGLARYILDNPARVRNLNVLDLASGSGLVAIAAKMSGAHTVIANDIDPFCKSAITLNSELNKVEVIHSTRNLLGLSIKDLGNIDIILAGDVFYDKQMADQIWPFLKAATKNKVQVLIGDPGRSYLPQSDLEKLATYEVPVTRALEDSEVKRTIVWQVI